MQKYTYNWIMNTEHLLNKVCVCVCVFCGRSLMRLSRSSLLCLHVLWLSRGWSWLCYWLENHGVEELFNSTSSEHGRLTHKITEEGTTHPHTCFNFYTNVLYNDCSVPTLITVSFWFVLPMFVISYRFQLLWRNWQNSRVYRYWTSGVLVHV